MRYPQAKASASQPKTKPTCMCMYMCGVVWCVQDQPTVDPNPSLIPPDRSTNQSADTRTQGKSVTRAFGGGTMTWLGPLACSVV